MNIHNFKDNRWSGYIMVACVAVTLHAILSNLGLCWNAVKGFLDNFTPLILGCVLAYLINPLAKLYANKVFRRIPKEKLRWSISVILAVLTVILLLAFLLGTLIPQLVDSAKTFTGNFDGYIKTLQSLVEKWKLSQYVDIEKVMSSSENIWETVMDYVSDNIKNIVDASADAGKSLVSWVLGLILSIYLLLAKDSLKSGVKRLLKAVFARRNYEGLMTFFARCDAILARYIVYSLIDGMIIGVVNAVFMGVVGMQYVGLVSVVVAVTNLIPTFGPIIGAVIGGFVLLLVNPLHALAFIIFTMVLQTCDGYIIKPKLFGDSLGISSLLILVAVIVGGNMFGVIGILLAIPFAAILDFVYKDYVLASLERKRSRKDGGAYGRGQGRSSQKVKASGEKESPESAADGRRFEEDKGSRQEKPQGGTGGRKRSTPKNNRSVENGSGGQGGQTVKKADGNKNGAVEEYGGHSKEAMKKTDGNKKKKEENGNQNS